MATSRLTTRSSIRTVVAVTVLVSTALVAAPSTSFAAPIDCPAGAEPLARASWEGGAFVVDDPADPLLDVAASLSDGDGEPHEATWTSDVPVDVVVVKAGRDTATTTYPATLAGTITSPTGAAIGDLAFCAWTGGLIVDLANDADGDGIATDLEATEASRAVPFSIAITNAEHAPVTITDATLAAGTGSWDLDATSSCALGDPTLEVGETFRCELTIDRFVRDHAAPPRDGLTATVTVTATSGGTTLTGSDTTTVVNPNAGRVSVDLVLTSDADGDGVFTTAELAPAAGADVVFRATVSNTSPGTVMLTGLMDRWRPPRTDLDLLAVCPDLDGVRLRGIGGSGGHDDGGHDDGGHEDDGSHDDGSHDDGSHDDGGHEDDGGHDDGHTGGHARPTSVTCEFTLSGHTPRAGRTITHAASVTVVKPHAPDRIATADATASVTTARALPPGQR